VIERLAHLDFDAVTDLVAVICRQGGVDDDRVQFVRSEGPAVEKLEGVDAGIGGLEEVMITVIGGLPRGRMTPGKTSRRSTRVTPSNRDRSGRLRASSGRNRTSRSAK